MTKRLTRELKEAFLREYDKTYEFADQARRAGILASDFWKKNDLKWGALDPVIEKELAANPEKYSKLRERVAALQAELEKIPDPRDLMGGDSPMEWMSTNDGRYERSYIVSERDQKDGLRVTVTVWGSQFSDGATEREIFLDGALFECDGLLDAVESRALAGALLDAADLASPSISRNSIVDALNSPGSYEVKLSEDIPQRCYVFLDVNGGLNAIQARELAEKLIVAADEVDRFEAGSAD